MDWYERRKNLELTWLGVFENAGVKGNFKSALKVWAEHDVELIIESLLGAGPLTCTVEDGSVSEQWLKFVDTWAAAEVQRIHAELLSLDASIPKAPWEIVREKARQKSSKRLANLESEIVVYVRDRGGAIDFRPAVVAKDISKKRSTLKPARIEGAMRHLCKQGVAKMIRVGKDKSARFVLN